MLAEKRKEVVDEYYQMNIRKLERKGVLKSEGRRGTDDEKENNGDENRGGSGSVYGGVGERRLQVNF